MMQEEQRLLRVLIAREGKPDFLLMETPADHADAEILMADTQRLVKTAGFRVTRVDLSSCPSVFAFFDRLKDAAQQGYDIASIDSDKKWLEEKDNEDGIAVSRIEALNINREGLFRLPLKLMFWASPETIAFVSEHAPDLWSWRSSVFDLRTTAPSPPAPAAKPL